MRRAVLATSEAHLVASLLVTSHLDGLVDLLCLVFALLRVAFLVDDVEEVDDLLQDWVVRDVDAPGGEVNDAATSTVSRKGGSVRGVRTVSTTRVAVVRRIFTCACPCQLVASLLAASRRGIRSISLLRSISFPVFRSLPLLTWRGECHLRLWTRLCSRSCRGSRSRRRAGGVGWGRDR